MACDLCGKTGTPLVDLLDSYKTKEVQCICHDCEKIVNKQNSKLRGWASELHARALKAFMTTRRAALAAQKGRTQSAPPAAQQIGGVE